jgi:hypothetical protein
LCVCSRVAWAWVRRACAFVCCLGVGAACMCVCVACVCVSPPLALGFGGFGALGCDGVGGVLGGGPASAGGFRLGRLPKAARFSLRSLPGLVFMNSHA